MLCSIFLKNYCFCNYKSHNSVAFLGQGSASNTVKAGRTSFCSCSSNSKRICYYKMGPSRIYEVSRKAKKTDLPQNSKDIKYSLLGYHTTVNSS